jgi:hypothetical protein
MSYSLTSNIAATTATIINTGMLSLPTSSGTYAITTTGYGGGGGYASTSSWGVSSSNNNLYHVNDIVVRRDNGKDIRIADSIEMIMELLMIIPEDRGLLDKNPALRSAYDHHQQIIRETFSSERLKESFDTYHTIRKLVKEETESG